jgi:hypothetical protein
MDLDTDIQISTLLGIYNNSVTKGYLKKSKKGLYKCNKMVLEEILQG